MHPDYLQKYYYYERNHWWFRVREKIIRQQLDASLPVHRPLKILNAGCATGKSSQMLQEYGEVISVEKDHDTCFFLREQLNLFVVEASLESLPFEDDLFDVVCAFDVIEHVDDEKKAVAELYRVCKADGVLYCTVPAYQFLWSAHDEINEHKRRYTRKGIAKVLGEKFIIEYSTYFNTVLFIPIWFSRTILQRLKKPQKKVSDFAYGGILNSYLFSFILRSLFSIEILLLRYIKLSFGVSVLLRAGKPRLLPEDNKHLRR